MCILEYSIPLSDCVYKQEVARIAAQFLNEKTIAADCSQTEVI